LQNPDFGTLFETAVQKLSNEKQYKKLSNYISSDLSGLVKNPPKEVREFKGEPALSNIDGAELAEIILMLDANELSSRGAKDILLEMYLRGGTAKDIANEKDLIQKSDPEEIKKLAEQIIAENPSQVESYKAGEEKLMQFFIGQGMKLSKGSANPGLLAKALKTLLNS